MSTNLRENSAIHSPPPVGEAFSLVPQAPAWERNSPRLRLVNFPNQFGLLVFQPGTGQLKTLTLALSQLERVKCNVQNTPPAFLLARRMGVAASLNASQSASASGDMSSMPSCRILR